MVFRPLKMTALCLTLGVLCSSLSLGQHRSSSSVFWSPQKIRVPVSNARFHLRLTDLSPDTDYIVGFRAGEVKEAILVAGEVHFSQTMPLRIISEIADWPADSIKVRSESVDVSGLSRAQGSVLIFVTIPAGTEVSVSGPGGTITSAKKAGSLLVQNGATLSEEVKGMRTLLSQLGRPNRLSHSKNTVELVSISGGRYVATPRGLASHLQTLKKPSYPVDPKSLADDDRMVLLRVQIDQHGFVKEVSRVQGNELLLDTCEEAVRGWQFRPFIIGENAVSVEASVFFFFGDDGTISSPVFREMGR